MRILKFSQIQKDLKHYIRSSTLSTPIVLFYLKFGFYGWAHLISVFCIQYSTLPLDDWLEKERTFPLYTLPLVIFAFYHYPMVTILALAGIIVANLRALVKKGNFLLERLEGLGSLPIYVLPLTIPIGLNKPSLYLAATIVIFFGDSFHKIGHRETNYPKLMWISGIFFLFLAFFIFATPTPLFSILATLVLISLIPFKVVKNAKQIKTYTQFWFAFMSLSAFYYYLEFFS